MNPEGAISKCLIWELTDKQGTLFLNVSQGSYIRCSQELSLIFTYLCIEYSNKLHSTPQRVTYF